MLGGRHERALRRTHEKTMAALASSEEAADFAAVRALAAEYIKLASRSQSREYIRDRGTRGRRRARRAAAASRRT